MVTVEENGKMMSRGVPQGSIASLVIFNIFINDFVFYIMETLCSLYNYSDVNKLAHWPRIMNVIRINIEVASGIAIKWFHDNNMKANEPVHFPTLCIFVLVSDCRNGLQKDQ